MLHCRGTGDRRGHPNSLAKYMGPLRWHPGWGRAHSDVPGSRALTSVRYRDGARLANAHSMLGGSACCGCLPPPKKGIFCCPLSRETSGPEKHNTERSQTKCMNKMASTPFCCRGGGSEAPWALTPPQAWGQRGLPPRGLGPVAVCSRASCHRRSSGCPTTRTGEQRTVHGSIDREVRRVKREHLVRHSAQHRLKDFPGFI